jgi:dihydroorotase
VTAILLRGGYVVDPGTQTEGLYDVLAVEGKIASVDPPRSAVAPEGSAIVNAQSCWVVPGLIDAHVHLRDPGFPEKETIASGLRAAAAGGFTTVAAMANTRPVNDSQQVTSYMLERARATHSSRLIPVAAVTRGLKGRAGVDYRAMTEAGARLFSDDGMPVDDEKLLTHALNEISALGYAISLHEEDRSLSCNGAVNAGTVAKRLGLRGYPNAAEAKRVQRDLVLAVTTRAPVHIAHVSTRESLELVREARGRGAQVTCEVTPHHFALDEAVTLRWGPNAKMNPPLRAAGDVEALRAAIADGTIDMIASDHAPHEPAAKHLEQLADFFSASRDAPQLPPRLAEIFADCANGIVGLETSLGLALELVHRSVIGAARLVEMMSLNPARLLRLERGTLATGSVADVTVIDPNLDWAVEPERFRSKSRNTPFMGMRLKGRAILTMVGGEIVYDGRRGET